MAKGIFCLETASWDEDSDLAKGQTSYEHFLRFLEVSPAEIPQRHFDVATKTEFEFYLDEWKKKKMQKRFPFLYLAFHGSEKGLGVIKDKAELFTAELADHLHDKHYDDAFIHFSSCYVLDDDKAEELLYNAGALSVSGYTKKEGVGWYEAAAFEMLFLVRLFAHGPPDSSLSMRAFVDELYDPENKENEEVRALGEALDFHLWYRVDHAKMNTDEHPPNVRPVLKKDMTKKWES